MNNPYAKLIQEVEKNFNVYVGFTNENELLLRSSGFVIQDHMDAEDMILKSKLFKYSKKEIQQFDKLSGTTYTRFLKRG